MSSKAIADSLRPMGPLKIVAKQNAAHCPGFSSVQQEVVILHVSYPSLSIYILHDYYIVVVLFVII